MIGIIFNGVDYCLPESTSGETAHSVSTGCFSDDTRHFMHTIIRLVDSRQFVNVPYNRRVTARFHRSGNVTKEYPQIRAILISLEAVQENLVRQALYPEKKDEYHITKDMVQCTLDMLPMGYCPRRLFASWNDKNVNMLKDLLDDLVFMRYENDYYERMSESKERLQAIYLWLVRKYNLAEDHDFKKWIMYKLYDMSYLPCVESVHQVMVK